MRILGSLVFGLMLSTSAYAEYLDIKCADGGATKVVLQGQRGHTGLTNATLELRDSSGRAKKEIKDLTCKTRYGGDIRNHITIHCYNQAGQIFNMSTYLGMEYKVNPNKPTHLEYVVPAEYRIRVVDPKASSDVIYKFEWKMCKNDSSYDA